MKIPVINLPTLREAANTNREMPFVWFPPNEREAVKPYLSKLKTEYAERKHPFLLRSVGQGGVYPAESHWLVCENQENDTWIRKHLGPLIAVSEVLPEQQLVIYHTGCLGDLLAACPIFRTFGKVHLKIGNFQEPRWQNRNLEGTRYESVRPLLETQPYIQSISFEHGAAFIFELEHWRVKHHKSKTLTECQADYLNIANVDMSPWLTGITPSPISAGKVVIARTPRYHNLYFPWRGILAHPYYEGKFLFIGLPEEHAEFCREVGVSVPYQPTINLLEVAELIAGSSLFIGNQSSPCWIAMGLGHRLIQETCPEVQDSIVRRDNAQFALVGEIEIRPL